LSLSLEIDRLPGTFIAFEKYLLFILSAYIFCS
jgi:hypothetical protein